MQGWTVWPQIRERRVSCSGTAVTTISTPGYAFVTDFNSWLENQPAPTATFNLVGNGLAVVYNRVTCQDQIFYNGAQSSVKMFCPDVYLIKSTAKFNCTTGGINHYTSLRLIEITP